MQKFCDINCLQKRGKEISAKGLSSLETLIHGDCTHKCTKAISYHCMSVCSGLFFKKKEEEKNEYKEVGECVREKERKREEIDRKKMCTYRKKKDLYEREKYYL